VRITSARYPLTLRWKNVEVDGKAVLIADGKEIVLSGKGTVIIADPDSPVMLRLSPSSTRELPASFAIEQNYPNPFNPVTVIGYQLPVAARVTMKVYNILGEEVVTLIDEVQEAGYKSLKVDMSQFSSGVYYYKLSAGTFTEIKKMMLVR
jgi:hypothetical protein